MSKYMTKQRKTLLDYLSQNADRYYTAKEIADELESEGISISAVYRNLSELEEEHKVRRQTKIGNREVYYQFMDGEACKDHIHLSCKSCGKVYHADDKGAEELTRLLSQYDDFKLDKKETVLFGLCKDCASSESMGK